MDRAMQRGQRPCPKCGSLGPEIDIFCNHCGHFLIDFGRKSLLVLLVAVLSAVVLFRVTGSIWPLYLLAAGAILHLYAVAFSRGAALVRGAVFFAASAGGWGLWELSEWLPHVNRARNIELVELLQEAHDLLQPHLNLIPLPLWLVGTVWSLMLG